MVQITTPAKVGAKILGKSLVIIFGNSWNDFTRILLFKNRNVLFNKLSTRENRLSS